MTLCDQQDGAQGLRPIACTVFDLGDAVETEQAEGQVAEGRRGPGAISDVGLLVVFMPDGVAGAVGEIFDPQCRRVCGDISAADRRARLVTTSAISLLSGCPACPPRRGG